MAGQGTLGVSGLNAARIDGSSFFLKDKFNVWGLTVAPMAHHDYFAFAGYFLPKVRSIPHISPSYQQLGCEIGNPAAQEAVCAAYVQGMVNPNVGGDETVDRYRLALFPAYAAKMKSLRQICDHVRGRLGSRHQAYQRWRNSSRGVFLLRADRSTEEPDQRRQLDLCGCTDAGRLHSWIWHCSAKPRGVRVGQLRPTIQEYDH